MSFLKDHKDPYPVILNQIQMTKCKISQRSGVQLPKITIKRPVTETNKVPTTCEGQLDESKKSTKEIVKENSSKPQDKEVILVREYVSPIPETV